jgi:shikimate dehydrogenase
MPQTVGLIGYPLGHSISPIFQQAAFDELGLDVTYGMWEVPAEGLAGLIKDIRTSRNILGANVTLPHKGAVIPLLDEIDPLAAKIGAVNTIVKTPKGLKGYNTDAPGFLRSLTDDAGFDPIGKPAAVIGAGGVSRAVCFMLVQAGVSSLHLFDIETGKARALVAELDFSGAAALESNQGVEFEQAVKQAGLVVNCTPLGMKHSPHADASPLAQKLINPDSLVVDVVYNPPLTPLLKLAQQAGASTLGGLPMLVYQGVLAFELWTGQTAPAPLMMQKALAALPA